MFSNLGILLTENLTQDSQSYFLLLMKNHGFDFLIGFIGSNLSYQKEK